MPYLWRKPWLYIVAVFCGFMFATAGTAVAPSSAAWMSGIVCSSPYHLSHTDSNTSYGNVSQTSIGFNCVNGQHSKDVGFLEIAGLQWLLGSGIALALFLGVSGLAAVSGGRRTAAV
jgi:hypothetical protein